MSEDNKQSKNANARRAILKSMAAGGGAMAAGKMVPEKWAEPVVESVLLPAHALTSGAQTSGLAALSGLYGGPATFTNLTLPSASPVLLAKKETDTNGLIDFLIPSSYAYQPHSHTACTVGEDSVLAIYVNQETGLVNICISAAYINDGVETVVSATSTLTETGIADVIGIDMAPPFTDITDDGGDDDYSYSGFIDLTGMVESSGNMVTGTIRIYSTDTDDDGDVGDNVNCSTSFTAEFTGGSFSCEENNPQTDDD